MFGQSFSTTHNFLDDEVVRIWHLEKRQYALNA
jgi:hypothetical protein